MIQAVLFDLDGTLLDIDLQEFLREYFALLGPALARTTGINESAALDAVMQSTAAMYEPHDGRTNREVFNECFTRLTGADLEDPRITTGLAEFYRDSFPSLQSTHRPHQGAHAAVSTARKLNLKTALATNPIFPRAAILERLRWAELDEGSFDLVTSYENAEACKPLPRYYRQISEALGVDIEACLMVGDDPGLDMAAADVGMQTFYVGNLPGVTARWSGSIAQLGGLLARLV